MRMAMRGDCPCKISRTSSGTSVTRRSPTRGAQPLNLRLSRSRQWRGSSVARGLEVFFPLTQTLEKFIAFTAAADEHILVLEHRLDNPQDRFGTQIVSAIKTIHRLKNFV